VTALGELQVEQLDSGVAKVEALLQKATRRLQRGQRTDSDQAILKTRLGCAR
jgi:hypothetical protein